MRPLEVTLYLFIMNNYKLNNNNPNTLNYKVNQNDCDIILSTYMKCLVRQNINCEKFHDQLEKCLKHNYYNHE
jgi:hypothetical protein